MSMFSMYLIVKLDDIVYGLGFVAGICGIIAIVFLIVAFFNYDDDEKLYERSAIACKISIVLSIVFILLFTITPTTKQMCAILVVPKIINSAQNNQNLMKLPDEIIKLGSEWIKKMGQQMEQQTEQAHDRTHDK